MPGLTPEGRDLVSLTRQAWDAVDDVLRRFWREIQRILDTYTGPIPSTERRFLMRRLDRVIDRVYGATLAAALVSELFTTLLRVTDAATERPFLRALERVRRLVERRSPGWWTRIQGQAVMRPADPFLRVVAAFDGPAVERARFLRSRIDPQRRWVEPKGYRLSDRVWRQGRDVRRAIDARIAAGIRRGEDALSIARDLERYLNPDMQPMRVRADGQVIRRNETRYPGRGGWGSYPARRLAQTELQRAYNAATIEAGKVTPGSRGMKWNLSNAHVFIDHCDDNANRSSRGMERGEYTFAEFPRIPDHPMCRCNTTVVMASREDVIDLIARRYGP